MDSDFSLRTGTASGTLLSVMPRILSEDISKTVILALIGAFASFCFTLVLKWIMRQLKSGK